MNKDPAILARKAAKKYLEEGKVMEVPRDLPRELLEEEGGVFVTVKNKQDDLRGCIGTYAATRDNLAEEIIYNAIGAVSRDDRFLPVREEELKDLCFEVSVIRRPRLISDMKQLDPERFGVMIRSESGKSALLLPDLPGIRNAREQIIAACNKGGIVSGERISVEKFEVERYEE